MPARNRMGPARVSSSVRVCANARPIHASAIALPKGWPRTGQRIPSGGRTHSSSRKRDRPTGRKTAAMSTSRDNACANDLYPLSCVGALMSGNECAHAPSNAHLDEEQALGKDVGALTPRRGARTRLRFPALSQHNALNCFDKNRRSNRESRFRGRLCGSYSRPERARFALPRARE